MRARVPSAIQRGTTTPLQRTSCFSRLQTARTPQRSRPQYPWSCCPVRIARIALSSAVCPLCDRERARCAAANIHECTCEDKRYRHHHGGRARGRRREKRIWGRWRSGWEASQTNSCVRWTAPTLDALICHENVVTALTLACRKVGRSIAFIKMKWRRQDSSERKKMKWRELRECSCSTRGALEDCFRDDEFFVMCGRRLNDKVQRLFYWVAMKFNYEKKKLQSIYSISLKLFFKKNWQ